MLFIGLSSLLITLNHAPWSRSHLSWAVQAWWELLIKQTWSLELRSRSLRLESQAPMRNVLQSPRHLERRTQARLMLDSRCVASVLLASLGHQSSELTQLREAWGERWLRAPASSQEHQPLGTEHTAFTGAWIGFGILWFIFLKLEFQKNGSQNLRITRLGLSKETQLLETVHDSPSNEGVWSSHEWGDSLDRHEDSGWVWWAMRLISEHLDSFHQVGLVDSFHGS